MRHVRLLEPPELLVAQLEPSAASASSTGPAFVAPTIGAVTPGRPSSQERATCACATPRSPASFRFRASGNTSLEPYEEAEMSKVQESIELDVPVTTAYNQWTQFEKFPQFMEHVDEVRQLDDTHLRWKVTVVGETEEFDAEVTEQIPDTRVAWQSTSGRPNGGAVDFHPLPGDRSQIVVSMDAEPQGLKEKAADATGLGEPPGQGRPEAVQGADREPWPRVGRLARRGRARRELRTREVRRTSLGTRATTRSGTSSRSRTRPSSSGSRPTSTPAFRAANWDARRPG